MADKPCPFCSLTDEHTNACYFSVRLAGGTIGELRDAWNRRATPPSPSTAPVGYAWLPLESTEAMVHAAEDLPAPRMFGRVWRAMAGAALASRPAEVDDEGLPPLPQPMRKVYERPHGVQELLYYTAEQFRQGQRDAMAADRAQRGKGEA